MLAIDKYIHELLMEHDCVSIPGFGGMVTQRFRAEINPGTNLLRPPSKRISFHKELVANSHLLLNQLTANEKISQAKASEIIASTVAGWKNSLSAGDSVKLDGIGRFYLDKEGHVCFNQSLESNFDLDAFGLDIFRATAIKRDVEIKQAVTSAIVDNYKKSEQRFPFWRAAAVFAGIGLLLTVGFFKSDVSFPTNLKANFNPLVFSRTIKSSPAAEAVTKPEINREIDRTPATINYQDVKVEVASELVEPVIKNETKQLPFQVIVGSFKDISNAEELIADLRAKGYKPSIIEDKTSFSKVSIEGFNSRNEAVSAMRAYKNSVNKGAWIYKR